MERMLKEAIGFIHGVPENPDKTWDKRINGRIFTFSKKRESKSFFSYNCKCSSESTTKTKISSSSTGFTSDRNLTPDEVEQLPQFANFIASALAFAFPLKVNRR